MSKDKMSEMPDVRGRGVVKGFTFRRSAVDDTLLVCELFVQITGSQELVDPRVGPTPDVGVECHWTITNFEQLNLTELVFQSSRVEVFKEDGAFKARVLPKLEVKTKGLVNGFFRESCHGKVRMEKEDGWWTVDLDSLRVAAEAFLWKKEVEIFSEGDGRNKVRIAEPLRGIAGLDRSGT